MFSNLQNKIDLKRIKEETIPIDNEFSFKEDFDVVNQTLSYFANKKHETNNILIKEEVIEFENDDIFNFIDQSVDAEQSFIYNDADTLETLEEELIDGGLADGKTVEDIAKKHDVSVEQIEEQITKGIGVEFEHVDDPEKAREIAMDHLFEIPDYYDRLDDMETEAEKEFETDKEALKESYLKYHKEKKPLVALMEEANKEYRSQFDAYRMVMGDHLEDQEFAEDNNEYDVKSLFDPELIDKAREEHLEHIHTINWLEKQLVEYRKQMNDLLMKGPSFQIKNNLKKLDINDTEEIKNKIKDLQESISFLESKANTDVLNEGVGVVTWLLSALSPVFGGIYASSQVKAIVRNTLMQKPSFSRKVHELQNLKAKRKDKDRQKTLVRSIKQEIDQSLREKRVAI